MVLSDIQYVCLLANDNFNTFVWADLGIFARPGVVLGGLY